MLELTKEVKPTPAPDPGAGAAPEKQKPAETPAPGSPIERIQVVRPGETALIKPNLPPAPEPKKPKGKERRIDPALADLKVPLAKFIKTITGIISERTGRPAWTAKDDEAQDIEKAFDVWINYRFPKLKGAMPEAFLIMAVLGYLIRVQADLNATAPAPAQVPDQKK